MRNLKIVYLFAFCLSCIVLWGCSDDDDDSLRLYSEYYDSSKDKTVNEQVTSLNVTLLSGISLHIAGGGGNSYSAVSSDPSVVVVSVQDNYLHLMRIKPGTTTITITGADQTTLAIPVTVSEATSEIKILKSSVYIRSEIDTEEYQTEIDAIKKEIEEALLPVESRFDLKVNSVNDGTDTKHGTFTLHSKGGTSVDGTFKNEIKGREEESPRPYILYTFSYNDADYEYSINKFGLDANDELRYSPAVTEFLWIADFTDKYAALYPHLKLTQAFGVQEVYISIYK